MAKVVATTNKNIEEGNGILDKFNIDHLLSKDFTKDTELHKYLNGKMSELPGIMDNVNSNIDDFLNAALGDFRKGMKEKVNEYISEEIVSIIKEFDEIQLRKIDIEEQIKNMEKQSFQFENNNDLETQMKKMEHRIKINELKRQYDSICKAYIEAYTKGLEKTLIHEEFNLLVSEISSTENELFKQIELERAALEIRLKVLELLSHKIDITDRLRHEINSRLNAGSDYAEKIIRSSKKRIPAIQAIVK